MIRKLLGTLIAIISTPLLAQTNWQAPVTVATAAQCTCTVLRMARLAVIPDDTVAAAWIGSGAITSGTQKIGRTSNVYTAFSYDRGLTWSPPKMISNPAIHNIDVSISAADNGTIGYVWTSGDALSGYRLHLASTPDNGNSFTSYTLLQDVEDSNQGILHPEILQLASQTLVAGTFIMTDITSASSAFISTKTEPSGQLVLRNRPTGQLSSGTLYSTEINSIAESNGVIIAAGTKIYRPQFGNSKRLAFTLRSLDSGVTWEGSKAITLIPREYDDPILRSDHNGTIMVLWKSYSSVSSGEILAAKSFDNGDSLSSASLVRYRYRPYNYDRNNTDLCGDGNGKWLVASSFASPFGYVWTIDNGDTWTEGAPPSVVLASRDTYDCEYLGCNKWGVVWSDWQSVSISLLDWGTSSIGGWALY